MSPLLADLLTASVEIIANIAVIQLYFNCCCIMMNCTDDLKLLGSTQSLDPAEFGNRYAVDPSVRIARQYNSA